MQIDLLNVNMGSIIWKDYSVGPEPTVKVYDVNLKKSYKDITSAQQLALLILTEPMKQAGIKGATIYGAAMLTGVGFVPVVAVATFAGKDSVEQSFDIPLERLYQTSLKVLGRIGKVIQEDRSKWLITAEANGADVVIRLKQASGRGTQITVSARKDLLPKPEVANGVLYQITQELK